MIPTKTREILGAQIAQADVAEWSDRFQIGGNDLNHLRALAMRLDLVDGMGIDERREWANWLHLTISHLLNE